jgi:hypothetical protein
MFAKSLAIFVLLLGVSFAYAQTDSKQAATKTNEFESVGQLVEKVWSVNEAILKDLESGAKVARVNATHHKEVLAIYESVQQLKPDELREFSEQLDAANPKLETLIKRRIKVQKDQGLLIQEMLFFSPRKQDARRVFAAKTDDLKTLAEAAEKPVPDTREMLWQRELYLLKEWTNLLEGFESEANDLNMSVYEDFFLDFAPAFAHLKRRVEKLPPSSEEEAQRLLKAYQAEDTRLRTKAKAFRELAEKRTKEKENKSM